MIMLVSIFYFRSLFCVLVMCCYCFSFESYAQNALKESLDFNDSSQINIPIQPNQGSRQDRSVSSPNNAMSSKSNKLSLKGLSNQEIQLAFKTGQNAYLYGNYDLVIESLQRLVSPNLLLSNPDELATAYELLGLAYFYLNRTKQAKIVFKDLIFFRPNYSLDPVRVPPDAVIFFQQLKDQLAQELAARQAALDKQREQEVFQQQARAKKEIVLEYQRNQRTIAFLPFGIGQFQNQDYRMGYFFLVSQILTASASIIFFASVESLRQGNGKFSQEDLVNAQNLQAAQLVTGSMSLGLMFGGMIHALLFFKEKHFIRRFDNVSRSNNGFLTWHF